MGAPILNAAFNDRLARILAPEWFCLIVAIGFGLSFLESKIGWGNYDVDMSLYYAMFAMYIFAFYFSTKVAAFLYKETFYFYIADNDYFTDKVLNSINVCFFLAVVLQLWKFINIGDVPLIGDPFSRYKLTMSGLADYPSRLLGVISIFYFWWFKVANQKKFFAFALLGLLLNALLMQRQEVLFILFGFFCVAALSHKITINKLLSYFVIAFLVIYVVVGFGAVLRFGDSISGSLNVFEVAWWVVISELSAPVRFGAFVVENSSQHLGGLYLYGDLFKIFRIDTAGGGAELIKSIFTDAETAQSISAPFSYYLDFGMLGVLCFGVLNGFFASLLYHISVNKMRFSYYLAYVVFIFQLYWSLRSGTSPLTLMPFYLIASWLIVANSYGKSYALSFVYATFVLGVLSIIFKMG